MVPNKKKCCGFVSSFCNMLTETTFQTITFSWAEDHIVNWDWTTNSKFLKVSACIIILELSLGQQCLSSKAA